VGSLADSVQRARLRETFLILATVPILFLSCLSNHDAPDNSIGEHTAEWQTLFEDGSWDFRADRQWRGYVDGVQSTLSRPPEEQYQPISESRLRSIVISEHGHRIRIAGDDPSRRVHFPLEGSRSSSPASAKVAAAYRPPRGAIVYHLDTGTFAGGLFIVWGTEQGVQAELTLFGSGVPMVESERGTLTRTP